MEGKGIAPDFVHADGALVFVSPQRAADYWQQELTRIEKEWDDYDALPPEEAKARWKVAKHYGKHMSDAVYFRGYYRRVAESSLYTHLITGLTDAESMDEANAFAEAFKEYTDVESARLSTQIQAFSNLSFEVIQRLKAN